MAKKKTELQRQKEYGDKQARIYEKFHKKIVKARKASKKASRKVNKLESDYTRARDVASKKFWAAKTKRTAYKKRKK